MFRKEVEVYIALDGWGRAAIVQRLDGFYCIYVHGLFPVEGRLNWNRNKMSHELLYADPGHVDDGKSPETGVYGTVEDARRQLLSLPDFSDAMLKQES